MSAWNTGAGKMPGGTVNDPHVYIAIDPSGLVTIITNRSEMGTGVRTSLPMVVADEMEADWSRVRVAQAPGDETKYGNQDTDGSRSVRHYVQPMRQCGAAMRMMLEQAAATRWGVQPPEVRAENHKVVHLASGNMLGYGELAKAASALPTPPVDSLKLKDPRDFRYIGKGSIPIVDLHDITTGQRDLRHRREDPRHEVRGDRASAGGRRQAGLIRCHRGVEGPRRGEGGGGPRLARGLRSSCRSAASRWSRATPAPPSRAATS